MANIMGFLRLEDHDDEMVVIPKAEYERLTARAEDIADLALAAEGREGPGIPSADMQAVFAGSLHPLTAWRNAAGLSQTALAKKAGVRRETINDIEHWKNTDPRVKTILALARALSVEIENLLPPA